MVGVDVTQEEMERGLRFLADMALIFARQSDVGHIEVSVTRGSKDYISAYARERNSGDGRTCAEIHRTIGGAE